MPLLYEAPYLMLITGFQAQQFGVKMNKNDAPSENNDKELPVDYRYTGILPSVILFRVD